MIEVDWKPDRKKLREFGFIAVAGFGLFGALVAWKTGAFAGEGSLTVPKVLWGLGLYSGLMAIVFPPAVRPVYVVMTAIALPIGLVLGNVLMALLYYGLFVPIGLFFKLRGRDILNRKLDPEAESYWVETPDPRPSGDYYKQF